MFLLPVFAFALLLLWLPISLYLRNKDRKGAPPTMKSLVPFLGCALDFGIDPLGWIKKSRELGPVFSCTFFGKRLTLITHPSLHRVFFLSPNEVFSPREVYKVMTPIFGHGVVYDASYPRMREQLKFIATELRPENFSLYVSLIQEISEEYFASWGDSGEKNIVEELGTLIIKTASRCLLGKEVGDLIDGAKFAHLLCDLEEGINPLGVFYPWLPSSGARVRDRAQKQLSNLLREIISRRRANPTDNPDILNTLLTERYSDGTPVPDNEIVGILIASLFAGQHTSLIVASWTAMYLAATPKALSQLRREREEISGDNMYVQWDPDIKDAMYLEACVKESLRKHPPLIMLMRHVKKSTQVGNYIVPEGDIIAMTPLGAMRCEDIWSNPDEWDPERFLPPREEQNKLEHSFVGFGAGAHRCLGEKFGTMQSKTIITTLFHHFDIEIVQGRVPDPDYRSMVVGPVRSQATFRYKRRK